MDLFPVPHAQQRQQRGVENSMSPAVLIVGELKQMLHFVIDRDPLSTGGGVDAGDQRGGLKSGKFSLEFPDPAECFRREYQRRTLVW